MDNSSVEFKLVCGVKVDEVDLDSFLNWTAHFWLLIDNSIALIWWVGNTW